MINVRIEFRDDKAKTYKCIDLPYVGGDWIILYMKNLKRMHIPAQAIKEIETQIIR